MAKRKNNRRRRQSRWLSDAALQALVRFGPEESGLRAAQQQAASAYSTTIRQADATSRGIRSVIDEVQPQVVQNYTNAGLQAARAAHVAQPTIDLAGVPDSMKAAVAAERAGFTARLGESQAQATTELGDRRVQAVEGAAFAKRNAREVLASELTKLFERQQDVNREKGAFTIAQAGELQRAAQQRADTIANQEAGRAVQRRGQDLTKRGQDLSHADRVASRKEAGGPKKKTQGELNRIASVSDEVSRLIGEAQGFKKDRAPRYETAAALLKGAEGGSSPVYTTDPKTGKTVKKLNPDGTPVEKKIPGLDKAKSQLLLSVALDVAYDGHVSRANHRKLLKRGLSIRDLGLPSYGEWKKKRQRNVSSGAGGGPHGTGRP